MTQETAIAGWRERSRETTSLIERALHVAYEVMFPQTPAGSITLWDYEGNETSERLCVFLPGVSGRVFGRDRTVYRAHPLCQSATMLTFVNLLNAILYNCRHVGEIEIIEAGGQLLFMICCEAV